jgi:phosphatidylserine decarboxylase
MLLLLRRLPQGALSRGFGHIADIRLPAAIRPAVLSAFARMMGIDVSEAERPLREYASINEFFVRRLRSGVRSVDARPDHVVSPVDGVIGQFGRIHSGTLMQAKGRSYRASALLDDEAAARAFEHGSFLTIYLSPRHYHRIHAPQTGSIGRADHIPGALLPVNQPSVMHIDALFPRNERLLCYIESEPGTTVVVAVGAYNVGRISAAFDPAWQSGASVTNKAGAKRTTRRYETPIAIVKGAEIMAFHLGSTIVMLFDDVVRFDPAVVPGAEVRMGTSLGVWGTPQGA